MESQDNPVGEFVFVACHPGVTGICRTEMKQLRPDWVPAFSRPGFLTYRLPQPVSGRLDLPATFARTFGFSLGPVGSDDPDTVLDAVKMHLENGAPFDRIHLWNRDWSPGSQTSDPDASGRIATALRQRFPDRFDWSQNARAEERILDLIRIDPGRWMLGWHRATSIAQRWPGGVPDLEGPEDMISRAWLKTAEALWWSGIRPVQGETCVEIGSAPGGSCQRLLESGAGVIAVDPADLDPALADHPRLTHLKKRGRDLAHRQISGAQWLLVDTNIAPASALQMTGTLVTGQRTGFRGLLVTLKMLDEDLATNLAACRDQVRSWGFRFVKTRHLAWGRREICLAALRQKSVRRFRRKPATTK